jgi:hypothetical protein
LETQDSGDDINTTILEEDNGVAAGKSRLKNSIPKKF